MTTDQFEEAHVDVDRDDWGRYKLPDPKGDPRKTLAWTRVTTLARTLTDEYNLNEWRLRQTIYGLGQREDLMALAAATHQEDRKQLDEIAKRAQEVAGTSAGASLGRAIHTFSQRLDGSGRMTGPDQYHPYLRVYAAALERAGFAIMPAMIERIVLQPEVRCAGQFDRLLTFSGTELGTPRVAVVGDLKTAKLDSIQYAWLEISIQLSTYAHATHIWDQGERVWHAMPPVSLERAIVMHLPQDLPPNQARCDIYEVNIVKGWEYALLAKTVRDARSAQKNLKTLKLSCSLADKVDEVRVPLEPVPLAIDTRECRTMVAGKPFGCGKPHNGPGQICDACAVLLMVNIAETPEERVRACRSSGELSELWKTGTAEGWWTPELTRLGKAVLAGTA